MEDMHVEETTFAKDKAREIANYVESLDKDMHVEEIFKYSIPIYHNMFSNKYFCSRNLWLWKTNKNSKNSNNIYRGQKTKFVSPSLEEVTDYCKDRNNNVDPQVFMDYYESNGWKVGKNPMKDWKAAVRNWERKETPKEKKGVFKYEMYQDL